MVTIRIPKPYDLGRVLNLSFERMEPRAIYRNTKSPDVAPGDTGRMCTRRCGVEVRGSFRLQALNLES